MKVIYIIPRLNNQGPVNQLYYLVKGLLKYDIEMEIITLFCETKDSRLSDFKKLSILIYSMNLDRKIELLGAKYELNRIIVQRNPDIIHSMTLPADLAVAIAGIRCAKWCVTLHCNMYSDYRTRFSPGISSVFIRLHESIIRKSQSIICCSKSIYNSYLGNMYSRLIYIQNGIDPNDYIYSQNVDTKPLREQLGVNIDKKIAVVVGSLDYRKNTQYIIQNHEKVRKGDDWIVLFLGDGPLYEKCKKRKYKNTVFLGKVDNVNMYLQCSDVYISASISEGLPLSVIEAGLMGKKMILSNIESHRELVDDYCTDNQGILLFDLNDPNGLANAMDDFTSLNSSGEYEIYKYFKEHFNYMKMCNRYFTEYSYLIKEGI